MIKKIKYLIIILFFVPVGLFAQQVDTTKTDTLQYDTLQVDSLLRIDTLALADTSIADTNKPKPLDRLIEYEAKDSLHFYLDSMITYMYRQVDLKSDDMELKAGKVRIDLKKNQLEAFITYDSLGRIDEKPEFSNEDDNFTAYYMKYNFKTRKGYATNVKTEQPEGYLHGSQVKIFPNGTTNILHGKFTTCDLDHPHYYINLSRAKYIPNKSIVTGPFYFVIEDIPFPIGLPFGYFPQRKYNSSGIVQPQIFQEQERGIGLINGGYYFVINDRMDFEVLADVFSKGSWGVKTRLRINNRYRYTANFQFKYTHVASGERILLDSRRSNMFNIIFQYNQKQKANPTLQFSANVNFSKGNYEQYNAVDIMDFVKSTSRSTINLTKRFRGTPFQLTFNASVTQSFRDSITLLDISAPQINFNMNRVQPFRKLFKPTSKSWFKDISIKLNANFQNRIPSFVDTLLYYYPDTLKYLIQPGFKYTVPVNFKPIRVLRYINISPTFNYVGYVYFSYIDKYLVNDTTVETDTIYRMRHAYQYNMALSASTNLYGLFRINAFGIKAIRHKMTPRVGFTYRPDFGDPKYGYYKPEPDDPTGTRYYNVFYISPLGSPGIGLQENLNFGINNTFEMKIRQRQGDTIVEKKVKLLDQLNISGNYNFAADSLRFSPVRLNASTTIKKTNFSLNATFDPYTIDQNGRRINVYEYTVSGRPLRMTDLRFQTSLNFRSDDFKKQQEMSRKDKEDQLGQKEQYVPYKYFDPSWNFSLHYIFSLRNVFNSTTGTSYIDMSQNLNFTFEMFPTPYWRLSIFSGYDFNQKQIVPPTIKLYRDLHCWEMFLQVTPSGKMKSYLFTVRIKSPMFRFFEFKRQRSWHDNFI